MMEQAKERRGMQIIGVSAGLLMAALAVFGALLFSGCTATSSTSSASSAQSSAASAFEVPSDVSADTAPSEESIDVTETIENSEDGAHAIQADGETADYSNVKVVKTGKSSGDEADFYGENAAVFATNGATLSLSDMVVESDGEHANGVFSYGEGTTVNISDSVIETSGNCSGGLMTTGGGTMNATNLNIHTTGNSSAAIRSDRGGGTVNVAGGTYATDGTGSPAIYSTADITVYNAALSSTASQGVVVEGKNSVTLNDVDLVADNNTKNSDKSDVYQAVMIYQSMSGDAAEGEASFTMSGGTLTNANGDIFFVNNTVATINLTGAQIKNNDADGVFLRAAAAGWGNEGSNGGHVTLNASDQSIDGDMVVDSVSSLNLYLKDGSSFSGAINSSKAEGDVYVDLSGGATWKLTADSYITSLSCEADSIDLNGHKLYVDGKAYEAGTAQSGEPIVVEVSASSHGGAPDGAPSGQPSGAPSGEPPAKPSGEPPSGMPSGEPPAKPSGAAPSGKPPAKPGAASSSAESASATSNASSSKSS